jgi:glyceraldehyde 3-phosphate dehydrogenase
MKDIGFIAESVRIPNTTGSLVILVVNFQEDYAGEPIERQEINRVFKEASENDPRGYLHYTEEQNVSMDIIGVPRAAAIIEGHETHTRTAEISLDLQRACTIKGGTLDEGYEAVVRIAVTQAVIYGWYDNEMGSYVNMLGDCTVSVAENMS